MYLAVFSFIFVKNDSVYVFKILNGKYQGSLNNLHIYKIIFVYNILL